MTLEVSGITLNGFTGSSGDSGGAGATTLSDLADVSFTGGLIGGQVLKFDPTSNVWQTVQYLPE